MDGQQGVDFCSVVIDKAKAVVNAVVNAVVKEVVKEVVKMVAVLTKMEV